MEDPICCRMPMVAVPEREVFICRKGGCFKKLTYDDYFRGKMNTDPPFKYSGVHPFDRWQQEQP